MVEEIELFFDSATNQDTSGLCVLWVAVECLGLSLFIGYSRVSSPPSQSQRLQGCSVSEVTASGFRIEGAQLHLSQGDLGWKISCGDYEPRLGFGQ